VRSKSHAKSAKAERSQAPIPPEIAALIEQANEAAATRLAELAESTDKSIAKAARRGLYMLKLVGIQPPAFPIQPQPFAHAPTHKKEAWMTSFDGRGLRMLLILQEDPYGGSPKIDAFVLNAQNSIENYWQSKIPRRKLNEYMKSICENEYLAYASIPLDYAKHILTRAAGMTRLLPEGATQALQKLDSPAVEYARPLIYEYLDPDALKEDYSFSREPQRLFESTFFHTWFLEPEIAKLWRERLRQSQETRLVLSENQRQHMAERIVDEATDTIFDGARQKDYRYRLEETALVLYLAGYQEEAKEALYHAISLREGIPPHAIPFSRHITKRTLIATAAEDAKKEEDAPRLIYRV